MEGEEHCAMRNWTQTSVTLVYNEKVKTNIEWECGVWWTVEAVCGQHGSDSISIYNGSGASTAYSHNTYTRTIHVLLCHWSFCPRNVSMNNEFTYCNRQWLRWWSFSVHSVPSLSLSCLRFNVFFIAFFFVRLKMNKFEYNMCVCGTWKWMIIFRPNKNALIMMWQLMLFSLFLSNLCRWWIECVWMTQNAIHRVVESTSFYPLVTSRMVYEIIKWIKELIHTHTPTHRRQPANGSKAHERMQKKTERRTWIKLLLFRWIGRYRIHKVVTCKSRLE